MIAHPHFGVEAWGLRECGLDLGVVAQTESLFALSNGHIGLRANLDEGEPHGISGTYLNAFHEIRPLPYAEAGFGYPESGQTVVNITDGKIIRLLVDDETLDVRYGQLVDHERFLDFRAGVLTRRAEWRSPAGRQVRINSTRLVSLSHRSIAAILYEVEPLDGTTRFVVQSELVANEPQEHTAPRDPRAAAALENPLQPIDIWEQEAKVVLVHRTRESQLMLAAGMDHIVEAPSYTSLRTETGPDLGRLTITTNLEVGQRLRLIKFIGYGWSSQRSMAALRDQVDAALSAARHTGWEGLVRDQRAYLDSFWERADVELEGDDELQQAVRFGLFHVLQAGARAEERGIPAKGLTGPGYDGHIFWDAESFVLQTLTYTAPETVAPALRWRQSTLPLARDRARLLGLEGATFPWRTIDGSECSSYWPAGTAAFHINADIADAVLRYICATDDDDFERDHGVDILVETARLWASLGHLRDGRFRIDGVTGPDEYSALADNNVYTNLMAQRNLRAAAHAAERHPGRAHHLKVKPDEIARWREAAEAMFIPYDKRLGVHPQAETFTDHELWDFEGTRPEQYPLLLHFPYFDIYRKQVLKQADLVLAMQLFPDDFTAEQKLRNFDYYEAITVRDSSLSACTQAVIAAEVGHLSLAHDYFAEGAFMDLHDRERNVKDGVHMAALAGAWIAAVIGLGGMREHEGELSFAPRLPDPLRCMNFGVTFKGCLLRVEVRPTEATYRLLRGEGMRLHHHGKRVDVRSDHPATMAIPAAPHRERPKQPPGREPIARGDRPTPQPRREGERRGLIHAGRSRALDLSGG